jgi:thioredoxin reductase (NADPH)
MTLIETRGHQLFPVLDAGQIDTVKRFASGPAREFAPGEVVFDVGERDAPVWLVLKGSMAEDVPSPELRRRIGRSAGH